ncbi:MAG: chemotaxis protein CheD [Pleomorphochaeta sp.]
MDIIIGIGEYKISNNPEDVLKTMALASCVGITFYSPIKKIAGMIHIALPFPNKSTINIDKPSYFATTGIPIIVNNMTKEYGCLKSELSVQIFGGANSINEKDFFKIGRKNIESVKNVLNEMNLKVDNTDVGGYVSRTLLMDVYSGDINVLTQPIKI